MPTTHSSPSPASETQHAETPSQAQHPGLDGVIAARTRLSRVDGAAGQLTIAGYPVEELAPRASFEAMLHLLLHDRLPNAAEERSLRAELASARTIDPDTLRSLEAATRAGATPMQALRLGLSGRAAHGLGPVALVGCMPPLVAAHLRLGQGQAPLPAPDASQSQAESFLFLLDGEPPDARRARALETYWNTVIDHGLNASTFTARVIASTGSDAGAALVGALGALEGPLHGGAPGPALAALRELRARGGDLARVTRDWVEERVARGERIMGFGHRVYRVRDPRADVLAAAARELLEGDRRAASLLRDAQIHERAVLETLARLKPERAIATNVEFYTALLLSGLGLPEAAFTPTFALGRAAGWIAHVSEQKQSGRLLRPASAYVGAEGRHWARARS